MASDIKRPQATEFAHGLPLILFIDYLLSNERGGQIPSYVIVPPTPIAIVIIGNLFATHTLKALLIKCTIH